MTVVELVTAVAVMAIVMAGVLPVLAGIRNSADTRWALSEMTQNARILNEHLSRHLAEAKQITSISPCSEANGYIEFETANGAALRYEVGSEGFIRFGSRGSLCELAGPVTSLAFTGYDVNDLVNPAEVAGRIRFVTWEVTFQSSGRLAENRTVTGAVYLRTNGNILWNVASASYDFANRQQGVEAFAYAGEGKPQIPDTPDAPSGALTSVEYDRIELDDGDCHVFTALSQANFGRVRFVFRIEESRRYVVRIAATWNGRGINVHEARADGASLYIWNYRSGAYEPLVVSADTELEVTLVGSVEQSAVDYIGGPEEDAIMLLVAFNDKNTGQRDNQLLTDYVKVDVTTQVESGAVLP